MKHTSLRSLLAALLVLNTAPVLAANAPRVRTYAGPLGTVRVTAAAEGGQYTFVEAQTDQPGESRLDKNVKRFFVQLHRATDPAHALGAAY